MIRDRAFKLYWRRTARSRSIANKASQVARTPASTTREPAVCERGGPILSPVQFKPPGRKWISLRNDHSAVGHTLSGRLAA
jgi:hypothetical protein